jgi:DNA-binding IclR family transcriptional regulator
MFGSQSNVQEGLNFELSALEFIAKNLAVPLVDLSSHFHVPASEVQEKLQPLVSRRFVTQHPGGEMVYSITADGVKEVERSVRTGLAAYL